MCASEGVVTFQETLVWCKPVVVFLMLGSVKISPLLGGRTGGKFSPDRRGCGPCCAGLRLIAQKST